VSESETRPNRRGGLVMPPAGNAQTALQETVLRQMEEPPGGATSSVVAHANSSEEVSADSSAVASANGSAVARTIDVTGGPSAPMDPLRAAQIATLADPLPVEFPKGTAATVTTVKIAGPIWSRLKVATALTGRNQQDLIAEALRDFFAKLAAQETGL